MIRIAKYFIILLLSVWLGLAMTRDPGYVLLTVHRWSIEMPLWFLGVMILVGFTAFYYLLRLASYTMSSSTRMQRWMGRRRVQQSQSLTTRGLIEFTEGQWQQAEKHLIKAIKSSDSPLINYLAAARAAQEQGATKRRDKYLRKAQRSTPEAKIAVELSQAQLQISSGQLEQALATLTHLQSLAPHHVYVLKLLQRLYIELGDWDAWLALLPLLKKRKVLNEQELQYTEQRAYQGRLQAAARKPQLENLQSAWQAMPKTMRSEPQLIAEYAQQLMAKQAQQQAFVLLRDGIKKQWDDDLVQLYGLVEAENGIKQLAIAETWLKAHQNHAGLLLTLGRLCIRNQLWGKARTYLENSLDLSPTPQTYAELAQLLEQLGETDEAASYYQRGLLTTLHKNKDLVSVDA